MAARPRPSLRTGATSAALLLSALCAVTMFAIYATAAHTARGRALDEGLWAPRGSGITPQREAGWLYDGISLTTVAVTTAALILLAAVLRRNRDGALAALLIGVTVASAVILKRGLRAIEPDGLGAYVPSFPSGHLAAAFSIALAAVLIAPPGARGLVGAVGAYGCGVVGLAALVLHAHRLSDLVGALLLGAGWAAIIMAGDHATRDASSERADTTPGSLPIYLALAGAPVVAGVSTLALAGLAPGTTLTSDLVLGATIPAAIAAFLVGALLATSTHDMRRGRA